jgi:hypothetical protein
VPDFISPPPSTPLPEVEDELARVRATPPERVALEVGWRFRGDVPAIVRPLLDDPQRALADLTDVMAAYFERAPSPRGGRRSAPPSRPTSSSAPGT